MWTIFALLSGLLFIVENLLARKILKQNRDPWAFSLFFSLIGTIICFPFFLSDPVVPSEPRAWFIATLIGLFIVANNLLIFKATKFLPPSMSGSLLKIRLIWVFLLGILILEAAFSWAKLLGVLLTVAAGILITRGLRKTDSLPGVSLILIATVFNALIIVLFKDALQYFSVASTTFIVAFLLPLILNVIIMPNVFQRTRTLLRQDGKPLVLACAAGALSNLALTKALSLGDAASVVVVSEAFIILLLVGEHVFLKEKESALLKLAAVLLAATGAILMQV